MSTAVDTAFEELMSAEGEPPDPPHIVCGICHPDSGPGTVMLCGYIAKTGPQGKGTGPVCARCVALDVSPLPCGHL